MVCGGQVLRGSGKTRPAAIAAPMSAIGDIPHAYMDDVLDDDPGGATNDPAGGAARSRRGRRSAALPSRTMASLR